MNTLAIIAMILGTAFILVIIWCVFNMEDDYDYYYLIIEEYSADDDNLADEDYSDVTVSEDGIEWGAVKP